ncbi:MAG: hypothetical protein GTN81_12310, partial [Proteobacteria bacterium]|nr:hypothetical protein [Pseudomonadota bacterium]
MSGRHIFLTLLIAIALATLGGSQSLAEDIDIYTNSGGGVQPNVLIIFDNSGSMNDQIPSATFDPATTYPGSYDSGKVYHRSRGTWDNVFRDSVATISCDEARTALQTEGFYNGKIRFSTTCGGQQTRYLRTGNYLNFLATNPSDNRPKLGVAKGTIQSYVNTTYGVRFGTMIFNADEGGQILRDVRDMTPPNRADLHNAIGQIQADT